MATQDIGRSIWAICDPLGLKVEESLFEESHCVSVCVCVLRGNTDHLEEVPVMFLQMCSSHERM